MLQGEPCQTGEDAARRVEQGGNKENTRRDGDGLRFFAMFSILYSAGLRIGELLELKPGDINRSRS